MFGKQFVIYFSANDTFVGWLPSIDWTGGKATHFVHPMEEGKDSIPLNKEWSLSIQGLWFYLNISYQQPSKENR